MLRILTLLAIVCINLLSADEHILIGIVGGTGSGKTTLARKLQEAFGKQAILIEQDSYYKDLQGLSLEKRAQTNFDHPDSLDFALLRTHLIDLKNNKEIRKPVYNFKTHSRESHFVAVQPARVIIVEGILLLAIPEVRDLFDLKIYIDADDDVRLLRRIERDIHERGRDFFSVQSQYLTTVKPMHLQFVEPSKSFADVIIPGVGDNSAAMALIVSSLKEGIDTKLLLHEATAKMP